MTVGDQRGGLALTEGGQMVWCGMVWCCVVWYGMI